MATSRSEPGGSLSHNQARPQRGKYWYNGIQNATKQFGELYTVQDCAGLQTGLPLAGMGLAGRIDLVESARVEKMLMMQHSELQPLPHGAHHDAHHCFMLARLKASQQQGRLPLYAALKLASSVMQLEIVTRYLNKKVEGQLVVDIDGPAADGLLVNVKVTALNELLAALELRPDLQEAFAEYESGLSALANHELAALYDPLGPLGSSTRAAWQALYEAAIEDGESMLEAAGAPGGTGLLARYPCPSDESLLQQQRRLRLLMAPKLEAHAAAAALRLAPANRAPVQQGSGQQGSGQQGSGQQGSGQWDPTDSFTEGSLDFGGRSGSDVSGGIAGSTDTGGNDSSAAPKNSTKAKRRRAAAENRGSRNVSWEYPEVVSVCEGGAKELSKVRVDAPLTSIGLPRMPYTKGAGWAAVMQRNNNFRGRDADAISSRFSQVCAVPAVLAWVKELIAWERKRKGGLFGQPSTPPPPPPAELEEAGTSSKRRKRRQLPTAAHAEVAAVAAAAAAAVAAAAAPAAAQPSIEPQALVAQLQAQVAQLQAQVAALQEQQAGGSAPTTAIPPVQQQQEQQAQQQQQAQPPRSVLPPAASTEQPPQLAARAALPPRPPQRQQQQAPLHGWSYNDLASATDDEWSE